MKRIKNAKGITLIALVITIIVLLILAAITLSTLAGRRGIITQAQNAEKEHTKAAALEDITIVTYQSPDNKGYTDTVKLEQGLKDIGATIKSKTETKWTVELNGYEFEIDIEEGDVIAKDTTEADSLTLAKMYKNAETAGCDGTNCTATDHLHIGDWVGYTPDTITSGKYLLASMDSDNLLVAIAPADNDGITQEDLYWRVWGYDENTDEVILISNTPTNQYALFHGFERYNSNNYVNYVNELNTICEELYSSNNIGRARSINMDDINKVSSYTEAQKIADFGDSTQPAGIGYTQTFNNCYYPDENSSTGYSIGTKTFTSNAYYYKASEYINNRKQLELMLGPSGNYKYWLASRFVLVESSYADFCVSCVRDGFVGLVGMDCVLCHSDGNFESASLYLRPIVHLESEVTKEQVPIIQPQNDNWTGK